MSESSNGKSVPEKIAAATVLLLRASDLGLQVLMVRRNSKIAFGGAWVFPGGRVDAEELAAAGLSATGSLGSGPGSGDDTESASTDDRVQVAARMAAVREVSEETGLQVAATDLIPWTYWIPPPQPEDLRVKAKGRRYTTWFFAAELAAGSVAIDNGEIHEYAWLRPVEALERHRAGEIDLVPPTWVTLNQLSAHGSVDEALEAARSRAPEEFRTKVLQRKPLTLAWAGDAGYETEDFDASGPRHRLTMAKDGWVYERTD